MCSWKNQAHLWVFISHEIEMFFSLKKPTWFWTDFFFGVESSRQNLWRFRRGKNHTFEGELARFPTQFGWGWWISRRWEFFGEVTWMDWNGESIYIYIYLWSSIVFFVGTLWKTQKKLEDELQLYPQFFTVFFWVGSRGNLAGDLISCFLNDVFSMRQDAMFQADMRAVLLSIEVRLKGYSQQQPPKKSGGKIWVCPKIRVLVPQNGWLDDIERSFLYPGKWGNTKNIFTCQVGWMKVVLRRAKGWMFSPR